MALPVTCIDICVRDRVPAVDHHSIADINADMRSACGLIGPFKEDQIAGSGIGRRNTSADIQQSLGAEAAHIPSRSPWTGTQVVCVQKNKPTA